MHVLLTASVYARTVPSPRLRVQLALAMLRPSDAIVFFRVRRFLHARVRRSRPAAPTLCRPSATFVRVAVVARGHAHVGVDGLRPRLCIGQDQGEALFFSGATREYVSMRARNISSLSELRIHSVFLLSLHLLLS